MEALENCEENRNCNENCDSMEIAVEQQYDGKKRSLLNGYNDFDNKSLDFEAHFNGNGLCSDDYDENDDGNFENR